MLIKLTHAALLAGAVLVSPAFAQTAAPAAPAPAATPASVSDAEVKMFAKAAIAADKVQKDASIGAADKPQKLADAVKGAGLEPTRFNEIANASDADPALRTKIREALVAEQQAQMSAAPATPATPGAPATATTPKAPAEPATPAAQPTPAPTPKAG
ncbi:DUF4168 domain-containing protein [Sphingomonas sp.]|uniref:DUF4168 domain-containing protein n=1 Tax=Sphingomonas sp. TaxID=28214 RepID=UPI001ECEECB3|nr:DUF4168 domain-containing protein [Sphingomonas sp.]MBX3595569.1 DUF4168 domain-containing protein [Sphingomonas sp.]